jgi:hypothetical protein
MIFRIFQLVKIAWKYSDFPWFQSAYGWWHPSMQPIYFKPVFGTDEQKGEYHVTQLFRRPLAFGVSASDLKEAVAREMGEPAESRFSLRQYEKLVNGFSDRSIEAENMVLDQGWTMIRSEGSSIGIVATQLKSAQAAVESAGLRSPQSGSWTINISLRKGGGNFTLWDEEDIKRFLKK